MLGPLSDEPTISASLALYLLSKRSLLREMLTSFTWLSSLNGSDTNNELVVSVCCRLTWTEINHWSANAFSTSATSLLEFSRFSIEIWIPPVNSIDGLKFIRNNPIHQSASEIVMINHRNDLLIILNGQ